MGWPSSVASGNGFQFSVFFVFKKVLESGAWSLRPVWDLRGVNQHFEAPPKFAL